MGKAWLQGGCGKPRCLQIPHCHRCAMPCHANAMDLDLQLDDAGPQTLDMGTYRRLPRAPLATHR